MYVYAKFITTTRCHFKHSEFHFISDTSAGLCFYPRSIALGPRNCIIAAHQRYNLRGFMHA